MLLVVYLTALQVDVFEITLVFKAQVPGHEYVLLLELAFTHTFFPLYVLLEGPHVDQSLPAHPCDPGQFPDGPVTLRVVGEVVDDSDGDEGVAGALPQREVETVRCEQLEVLRFLVCSL
jgi:hypothetical protein